ncbi:MAG: hypothetical protein SOX83_00400, partial [Sodaliphilus sp.]|nr:hypothetical protein [Sodaliphilus sp.]
KPSEAPNSNSFHKKAFSQKPGKRLYRRHFFPKKRPLPSKNPKKHVYFQCFQNIAPLHLMRCLIAGYNLEGALEGRAQNIATPQNYKIILPIKP